MRKAQHTHTHSSRNHPFVMSQKVPIPAPGGHNISLVFLAANSLPRTVFRMIVQSDSMDFRTTEDVKHLKHGIDFGKIVQNVNK